MSIRASWIQTGYGVGAGIAVGGIGILVPSLGIFLLSLGLAIIAASLFHQFGLKLISATVVGFIAFGMIYAGSSGYEYLIRPRLGFRTILFPYDHADGLSDHGIIWKVGYSWEQVIIRNNSDTSYDDLDATISPQTLIIDGDLEGDFASCKIGPTLLPAGAVVLSGPNGKQFAIISQSGKTEIIEKSYRLYCDKLPAKTQVIINLATVGDHYELGSRKAQDRFDPQYIDIVTSFKRSDTVYHDSGRFSFILK